MSTGSGIERTLEVKHLRLGNNVKECRDKRGHISQTGLAESVGVTKLTIHLVENRKVVPSTLLALKIASFFKKRVEKVFYLIDDQVLLDGRRMKVGRKKKKKKTKKKKKKKKQKAKIQRKKRKVKSATKRRKKR